MADVGQGRAADLKASLALVFAKADLPLESNALQPLIIN
jgi:hypothetical protein